MAITKNDVAKLYVALVNRVADKEGLDFWLGKGQDKTLPELANEMIQNEKTAADLTAGGVKSGDANSFVTYIYKNLLNKTDDQAGIDYWTKEANDKKADFGTILGWMLNALNDPEVQAKAPETAKLYQNKIAVAEEAVKLYDEAEKNGVDDKKFENYNLQLNSIFKSVTDNDSSLDNAKSDISDLLKDLSYNDIALTLNNDVIDGTAGNDKITGVYATKSSEKTLDRDDKIDGEAGDDVLAVDLKANFTGFSSKGGLSNVETLELSNDTKTSKSFNAKGITGLNKVSLDSAAGIDVTNLGNIVTLELKDLEKASVDVSKIYDNSKKLLDGDNDTQNLILDGVKGDKKDTALALSATGAETLNITAKGDKSSIKDVAVSNVKVNGSADLDVTTTADVKSFDASALTGNLTADLSKADKLESVKTGAGDDSITLDATKIKANVSVDAGAGENELIITTNADKSLQPELNGVDKLSVKTTTAAALTLDLSKADSVKEVNISSTADASAKTNTIANTKLETLSFTDSMKANALVDTETLKNINYVVTKDKGDTTGKVTAAKATELNVNVKGKITDTDDAALVAANATKLSVNVDDTKAAGKLSVTAPVLTELSLNNNNSAKFTLATTGLTNLAKLDVTGSGEGDITGNLVVKDINVSSTGKLKLADIGNDTYEENIGLTANGLSKLEVGAIKTKSDINLALNSLQGDATFSDNIISSDGNVNITASSTAGVKFVGSGATKVQSAKDGSVNIDLSNTLGAAQFGDNSHAFSINSNNVTYKASNLKAASTSGNDSGNVLLKAFSGDSNDFVAELGGSIEADKFKIALDTATNNINSITVSGDLGVGANVVEIGATGTAITTNSVDVSSLNNATTKIFITGHTINNEGQVVVNGSAGGDALTIKGATGQTKIAVTGDLGNGTNTFTYDKGSLTEANVTSIDFTGLKGFTTGVTIDTSTYTGVKVLKGTEGDDTFTLSAANANATGDAIEIWGNGGNDTFDVKLAVADTGDATQHVTLHNVNVGDKIKFADSVTHYGEIDAADTAEATSLKDAIHKVLDKGQDMANNLYGFTYKGETYLFYNDAGSSDNATNSDVLVKLAGVSSNFDVKVESNDVIVIGV